VKVMLLQNNINYLPLSILPKIISAIESGIPAI